MYKFSKSSEEKLATCHPDLQKLMNEVIKYYDCSIICGHRGEKEQNEAFEKGYSKLKFPNGKHNKIPSLAVDVLPYPFKGYQDRDQFLFMQGFIKGIATQLGIKIRLGIDFNGDLSFKNDSLFDGPHIELII